MIGSFLAILIPNTWIGGTLLYIVINVYRKCVLPDFMTAVLLVPIHWEGEPGCKGGCDNLQ